MLALALSLAPWVAQAQGQTPQVLDWRQANDAVGQFQRGHADVLRWEQRQTPEKSSGEAASVPAFSLPTAADAVRAAWSLHRDLVAPLNRLGPQAAGHIAAGHWGMLDPALQRRIHGVNELFEVAANARKAWFKAVAARQTLKHQEDAQTAAEAAAELGRRMAAVGNWSRMQLAQVELAEISARSELRAARLAALQAEWSFLEATGLDTLHERVALPDRLPEGPVATMTDKDWEQRVAGIQANLPVAQARKALRKARQAHAIHVASVEAYRSQTQDILKLRETIGEETLLRYNGMLESVWGLLSDVGVRSQAVVSAIAAQRDALVAEVDLQWVLQGGMPATWVSLGGGETAAAAAPGH